MFKRKDLVWVKNKYGYHDAMIKIRVPSITTIITDMIPDAEFEAWKLSVGDKYEEILKYCADRGTAMHRMCEVFFENYAKGLSAEESLEITKNTVPTELESDSIPVRCITKGIELFDRIYNTHSIREQLKACKGNEIKLYSPISFTRGALDIIYLYNGMVCVSDFKTSSKHIDEGSTKEFKYKVQLGGYAVMLEDTFGDKMPISMCSIICVSTSNDDIQEIRIQGDEMIKYKEIFRELVKKWHEQNNQSFVYELI